jgi:hypothetical protein
MTELSRNFVVIKKIKTPALRKKSDKTKKENG